MSGPRKSIHSMLLGCIALYKTSAGIQFSFDSEFSPRGRLTRKVVDRLHSLYGTPEWKRVMDHMVFFVLSTGTSLRCL